MQVASLIQSLLEQGQRDAEPLQAKDLEIREKDVKIQALIHELAQLRRLRYGVKSERLAPLQRDLFEETLDADLEAIATKIEQLSGDQPRDPVGKPKRPRAGRQPLPNHLPRIEHRHEPESCLCEHCGKERVKIGEDVPNNWM